MTTFHARSSLLVQVGLLGVLAAMGAAPAAAQGEPLSIAPGQSWASVLDRAAPGSTVVVKAGVHPQQSLVGRDYAGVTLLGESRTGTVVQGLYLKNVSNLKVRMMTSSPTGAYSLGAAFKISYGSRSVVLDDVTARPLTSTSTGGFDVSRGDASAPQDILISDAYYSGDAVSGSNGRGLRVWGGDVDPEQWPTNVTLLRAKFENSSADLVQIGGGRRVTIADSKLLRPKVGVEHNDGIQSYGSQDLVIRNNTITAAGDYVSYDQAVILGHAAPGNRFLKVTRSLVENNVVDTWRGQGIMLAGTDDAVVRGNTVRNLPPLASGLVVTPGPWSYPNTGAFLSSNAVGKTLKVGSMAGVTFG